MHKQPGLQAALEFERSLFSPIAVPHDTLEWMASERAQLEARLPPSTKRSIVSLKHLTDGEYRDFVEAETFSGPGGKVELTGTSREMYRTIRDNLPRFPVYVVPKRGDIAPVEANESVIIEGQTSELDLNRKTFDSSNKLLLLWTMIGIIKGARQPIIGFIAEGRENGLLYTVEPKTQSYKAYVRTLRPGERSQREEGEKLARTLISVANAMIKPRGACNDENICVRGDGKVFFRGSVFQATNTPQESMDFMLRNLSKSSLAFLEADGAFPPAAQTAFLETLQEAKMLNLSLFTPSADDLSDLPPFARQLAEHYRTRGVQGIPQVFKEWAQRRMKEELPQPLPHEHKPGKKGS
jgi:hypothetical protein